MIIFARVFFERVWIHLDAFSNKFADIRNKSLSFFLDYRWKKPEK